MHVSNYNKLPKWNFMNSYHLASSLLSSYTVGFTGSFFWTLNCLLVFRDLSALSDVTSLK